MRLEAFTNLGRGVMTTAPSRSMRQHAKHEDTCFSFLSFLKGSKERGSVGKRFQIAGIHLSHVKIKSGC